MEAAPKAQITGYHGGSGGLYRIMPEVDVVCKRARTDIDSLEVSADIFLHDIDE